MKIKKQKTQKIVPEKKVLNLKIIKNVQKQLKLKIKNFFQKNMKLLQIVLKKIMKIDINKYYILIFKILIFRINIKNQTKIQKWKAYLLTEKINKMTLFSNDDESCNQLIQQKFMHIKLVKIQYVRKKKLNVTI